jgi:UDP-3-O-acyl-N-acetylglucosamine deacetylase
VKLEERLLIKGVKINNMVVIDENKILKATDFKEEILKIFIRKKENTMLSKLFSFFYFYRQFFE